MKVKFSNRFHAISKRIQQLPEMYPTYIKAALLKDVQGILIQWHKGIKENTLGLKPLKSETVKSKRDKGNPQPATPLYGKGDMERRSYINMWQVRQTKSGWSLRIRDSNHHSGLPFREIYRIHEYGATISTKTATIQIPARPAATRAYQNWLKERKKQDPIIKKSITEFINRGRSRKMQEIEKLNKGQKRNVWYG